MSPEELIDSYVADVVRHLPRAQRADIALELRTLLTDELAGARSAAAVRRSLDDDAPGRSDAELVRELLRGFGRPVEVAARYHPSTSPVGVVDRRRLHIVAVVGAAAICVLSLLSVADRAAGEDVLTALQRRWTGALVLSALWYGLLYGSFAVAGQVRRRWPGTVEWQPRRTPGDRINRFWYTTGLVAAVVGVVLLVNPALVLDVMFGGRAAPAAYAALAYDDDFVRWRAPFVLAYLVGQLLLMVVLIVRGRWQRRTRQVDLTLGFAFIPAMGWAALGGPIFQAAHTDQFVKVLLLLITLGTALDLVLKLRRPALKLPA